MLTFATALAADPNLDLNKGATWMKGFLALLVTVALMYLTLRALLKHGRSGDTSGALSVVGAMLLCLIPMAVAGSIAIATGYGNALLELVTGVFS